MTKITDLPVSTTIPNLASPFTFVDVDEPDATANRKISFSALLSEINANSPASPAFSLEEHLSQGSNLTLNVADAPYQYVEPSTDIDVNLPAGVVGSFFRIRSLDGSSEITVKDDGGVDLAFLGNAADNGNGPEVRLMADFHYVSATTEWAVNIY